MDWNGSIGLEWMDGDEEEESLSEKGDGTLGNKNIFLLVL